MDNALNNLSAKDKISATWSCNDESVLIRMLKRAKEKGKWGDNNPKEVAWRSCIIMLSGSEKALGGAAKTVKVIRSRWQCVHAHHVSSVVCANSCIYSAKTRIQNN
jgi:hypothetical protein